MGRYDMEYSIQCNNAMDTILEIIHILLPSVLFFPLIKEASGLSFSYPAPTHAQTKCDLYSHVTLFRFDYSFMLLEHPGLSIVIHGILR